MGIIAAVDRPAEPVARLHLLGGFRLLRDGTQVSVPRSAARLLTFLAFRPGASPRTLVAGQLYGDVREDRARASLRAALWRLRRSCPGVVDGDADTIGLCGLWVDVHEIRREVAALLDNGCPVDAATIQRLRYDLLPGWYDDWLLLERERLRQHCLFALEEVANRRAAAGAYAEAVDAALAALQLEPLRERCHRTLIEIHLAAGDRVEAVRAFEAYRRLLADELGLEPSDELRRRVRGQLDQAAAP